MSQDPTPLAETSVYPADINGVLANSSVLSADVNDPLQRLGNRTRYLTDNKLNLTGGTLTDALTVNASTPNATALQAIGDGTGDGIASTGGNTSGTAIRATGGTPNGKAMEAFGTGSGDAIRASTTGAGYPLNVDASGGGPAINLSTGGLKFSSTQPAANADPGTNVSHATNQSKCVAHISTDGAGNFTVEDGFGVDDVNSAIVGNAFDLFLKVPLAATKYPMATVTNFDGTDKRMVCDYANSSTAKVRIITRDAAGVQLNPATNALRFVVDVKGRQ